MIFRRQLYHYILYVNKLLSLANMNNNMKEQTTQGGPPNMNTVTDASVTNNNNNQTVVTPLSHENKDRPNGTGMLAYE